MVMVIVMVTFLHSRMVHPRWTSCTLPFRCCPSPRCTDTFLQKHHNQHSLLKTSSSLHWHLCTKHTLLKTVFLSICFAEANKCFVVERMRRRKIAPIFDSSDNKCIRRIKKVMMIINKLHPLFVDPSAQLRRAGQARHAGVCKNS